MKKTTKTIRMQIGSPSVVGSRSAAVKSVIAIAPKQKLTRVEIRRGKYAWAREGAAELEASASS